MSEAALINVRITPHLKKNPNDFGSTEKADHMKITESGKPTIELPAAEPKIVTPEDCFEASLRMLAVVGRHDGPRGEEGLFYLGVAQTYAALAQAPMSNLPKLSSESA